MDYGYARVSSKTQNPDRQIRELKKQGIEKERIYIDKFSGKTYKRPNFLKLIHKLKEKDIVFFTSFDRIGRNYEETIEIWNYITKKKELIL